MAATDQNAAHKSSAHGGYEKRDIRVGPLVMSGIILLLFWIVAFLIAWALFKYFAHREARLSPPPNVLEELMGRQVPPQPRLQTAPLDDLLQLRREEDAVLDSYGWVDQQAGIVRVPIGRAIELLAQRGVPTRPQDEPPAPAAPAVVPQSGQPGAPAPAVGGGTQ